MIGQHVDHEKISESTPDTIAKGDAALFLFLGIGADICVGTDTLRPPLGPPTGWKMPLPTAR